MNPLPKRQVPPPQVEDEEDLWNDLPDPVSADAEEEWEKEGDVPAGAAGSKEPGGRPSMIQFGVREWDREEMPDEEETRPGVPDARLLMDDLRVEGEGGEEMAEAAENFGRMPASVGWVVFAALTVIAVLVGTLIYMTVLSEKNPTVNPLGIKPLVIEPEVDYPEGEIIADLLSRQDEARDLFGRFVHAGSPADVRALVREVPGVYAWIEQKPKAFDVPPGWKVPADARWEVHTDVDPVFGVLTGYDAAERKFQAFVVLENGKMLLDWEATVGHGTAPFSQLVDGTGDGAKVRLWVEPSPFYPAVYPEAEYRSFRVYTRLDDAPVWAFARRGTVPERELSALFHKSMFGGDETKAAMVLLSLDRGGEGAAPNQWLITDLLHKAWVTP